MYVYCAFPEISKRSKHLPNCLKLTEKNVILISLMITSVTSVLILFPFLSVALHESGTRNYLLGPGPNNTEVYLTPLTISTQNHTFAG